MFLEKIIWFSVLYGVTLGDEIKKDLDWWQTSIIYQVYPRSFHDSDGDGIGDLKGIEQRAEYFKWLGVGAVWLNPIFESPMIDFGYDIKNFTEIYFKFGTIADLKSLAKTLKKLGIKLILDFVPNHTSDQNEWFQKSIKKIEPYTDYYVWKDPRAWENGHPVPPNNWISAFNIVPAWTYNEDRKQFYLHNFHYKMPDLNYRSLQVQKEMENILLFWLEAGVDGFRIDSVPYLVENINFPDEAYIDEKSPKNEYDNLVHSYTKDQPETYEILRKWRMLFDNFTEFHKTETRLFLTEAYTSLEATMRYYGTKDQPISHVPFNFELIVKLSPGSTAMEYADIIHKWLNDMPQGMWPNWVIGNHDRKRVATIFGEEMVDVLNILVTMLPGTAVNYYGDELGMSNGFVRWDQTVDPQGLILGEEDYQKGSRDGCRTPMQWDNTTYAGFTKGNYTWLPLNANYWKLNLKAQNESESSHLKLYKLLSVARQYPTIQKGETHIFTPDNWTIIIERALHDNPTFIIVLNIGSEESKPDLSDAVMKLPKEAFVYAASTNSIHKRGEKLVFGSKSFSMRPKSGIIFSTELSHVSTGNIVTGLNVLCILCISLLLSQQFYV